MSDAQEIDAQPAFLRPVFPYRPRSRKLGVGKPLLIERGAGDELVVTETIPTNYRLRSCRIKRDVQQVNQSGGERAAGLVAVDGPAVTAGLAEPPNATGRKGLRTVEDGLLIFGQLFVSLLQLLAGNFNFLIE